MSETTNVLRELVVGALPNCVCEASLVDASLRLDISESFRSRAS